MFLRVLWVSAVSLEWLQSEPAFRLSGDADTPSRRLLTPSRLAAAGKTRKQDPWGFSRQRLRTTLTFEGYWKWQLQN